MYTNQIEGWMSEGELNWLYERAKTMNSILEIGCWKGRSTHALLSGARDGKGAIVYAVDHWMGSPSERSTTHRDAPSAYDDFILNTQGFGFHIIRASSAEALKQIHGMMDMIFIDGDHTYEAVIHDILKWSLHTLKLLCGHDYTHAWNGVKRAVDELIPDRQLFESIWWKELR